MLKIYQNRKDLAMTLRDTKTVVGKLELIFGVAIHVICLFFYLTIFNVSQAESDCAAPMSPQTLFGCMGCCAMRALSGNPLLVHCS